MQFRGPVPADLYHRYVEFKPFVQGMFTGHSLRGRLLNRALHHQHARIYNFDRTTKYGSFPEPCLDMTKQFLELVHYDEGGRIFTYIITLDGQLRFTETGKEFGIDLLSKHTMHSDVSIYIAFSGEFLIRRIKHAKMHKNDESVDPERETHKPAMPPPDEDQQKEAETNHDNVASSSKDSSTQANGSPPQTATSTAADGVSKSEPSTDPTHYELIIDNDSGTYRPNAAKLPLLREYLMANLPGLKVKTLDCQADADLQQQLKKEQRELKQKATGGKRVMYMQNVSMSSLSSSDEEDLRARAEQNGGDGDAAVRESRYKREMHKFMDGGRDEHHGDVEEEKGKERDTAHDTAAPAAETTTTTTNGDGEGTLNEKQ